MKRYQDRFGKAADVAAAIGYDMMELTILGLEGAGKDLTIEKFIAASETIKDWQNIFGSPKMSFGPNRRLGTRAFVLTQIKSGKFARVTDTLGE
jgi:branched-chain amino acid transport system substrate-binding protein